MDSISLGIPKGFQTEGERTWLKAQRAEQRARPVTDVPSLHAAAEPALSSFRAHTGTCSHLFSAQREEPARESHQLLLVKCHRAIELPRIISWPYFFKAANVQWEAFEIRSKPKFCQYTADRICASLGASQGSDGNCMKTGTIWLRERSG